jgi:hypothetical protein
VIFDNQPFRQVHYGDTRDDEDRTPEHKVFTEREHVLLQTDSATPSGIADRRVNSLSPIIPEGLQHGPGFTPLALRISL